MQLLVAEVNRMWFFRNKKREAVEELREEQLQKIRKQTHKYAQDAAKTTNKLVKLLNEEELGVTGKIFYATPGGGKDLDKKGKNK